jgi:hypothetical protein
LGSIGQSSILWSQNPGLSGWSWQDARQQYFYGLTKSTRDDRDKGLAQAFEGLGRQIHLVQDAASPAHARNDPHVLYKYENFIDDVHQREEFAFEDWLTRLPDTPTSPDRGWRSLDGNPLAPIPVARLLDTDRYLGTNPAITTDPLIGLAEYTNANFFSEDRIFTENDISLQTRFPYPRASSVSPPSDPMTIALANGATVQRRYYIKERDGAVGYRLAAVPYLRNVFDRFNVNWSVFRQPPTLDETVYRDYAERLIPRAVSYSTAMLDYFFRGRLFASGDNLSAGFYNAGDEAMEGALTLYYDDENEIRRPVPQASWMVTLGPSAAVSDLRFPPPDSPAPQVPEKYMLVFRGALGGEADAVAGTEVFIPSVIVVRLVKRSDGTPYQGVLAKTIDAGTREVLASGTTDQNGEATLQWRPGRTALFVGARAAVSTVNGFPIYWAGESGFADDLGDAKILRANDVDAQGVLRVAIPFIAADWPEPVDACTGFPLLTIRRELSIDGFSLDPARIEVVTAWYFLRRATFTRDDSGEEVVLYGEETQFQRNDVEQHLNAADLNRVGQVIGTLVWDSWAVHSRQVFAVDEWGVTGDLLETLCVEYPDAVETAPVAIVER